MLKSFTFNAVMWWMHVTLYIFIYNNFIFSAKFSHNLEYQK